MSKKINYIGVSKVQGDEVITNIAYLTPDEKEKLKKFLSEDKGLFEHIITKPSISHTRSYEQLKTIFLIIEDILNFLGEPNNLDNKRVILESIKNHLPRQTIILGGREYEVPKSISDKAEIPSDIFTQFIKDVMTEWRQEGCIFRLDLNETWGK